MKTYKNWLAFLLTLPLLFLGVIASAAEEEPTPSGTVSFESTSIAVGIGVDWGKGKLMFNDQEYQFKISGLGIAGAGVTRVEAQGKVYNLNDVADFPGTYTGGGLGLTLAAGGDDLKVSNKQGVVMVISSRNTGIQLNLGGGGMKVEMLE